MNLEETTQKVKGIFEQAAGFSDTLVFDFGSDGMISVDGGKTPAKVSNSPIDADCTISVTLEDFNSILEGTLDPQMAFMSGKLSVDGNMGVAMNLTGVLRA